jgi:signal transduction histidine kinase
MLTWPRRIQLSLVAVAALLALLLYALTFRASHNGSMLTVPVALAAWLFKQRGTLVVTGGMTLVLLILHTLWQGNLHWPVSLAVSFGIGMLVMLLEGTIVSALRDAVDETELGRRKAQQAEREIAKAYEQQSRLNELKDQFIINVNHELRTPLTAIYGYLELLHDHGESLDEQMRTAFLADALRTSKELGTLVNTIVDTAQIQSEQQTLQIQEVSLLEAIDLALSSLDPRERLEHPLTVEVYADLLVSADALALRQILRNLLINACKYTSVQTPIFVKAWREQVPGDPAESAGMVRLSVEDRGPGIPPTELPLLFGKFVRLSRDVSGVIPGTGLGLYVCKQLVEAMHGTIRAESSGQPGEGSCFIVTLPAAPSS